MKYLSLFTGIGGFELGIQQAHERLYNCGDITREPQAEGELPTEREGASCARGEVPSNSGESGTVVSCIGYSEIDKYAVQVYQHHFPEHINYGDITTINAEELPDFDLLVGGFPCQAFSIAGKRKGFDDTRGTLFFDIARILRAKRPRLLLLENVKGLLSHDNGNTFKTIISTLDELGYDLQWQVLNSKNHGVPQNRERVFIIGHLRGTPRPEVFPFGQVGHEPNDEGGGVRWTIQSDDERHREDVSNAHGEVLEDGQDRPVYSGIQQLNNPTHSNDRVYGTDGLSPTLNTMQGGRRQPFIAAERGRYKEDGTTEQKLEPRFDGLTNTLTGVEKDNRVFDGQIRRLTPLECERLQGFPDNWTAVGTNGKISDTQRYKMCGNAVTVNVIRDIIQRLCKAKPTHS